MGDLVIQILLRIDGIRKRFINVMKTRYKVPFFSKIRLYFNGFYPHAYYLYDFQKNDKSAYLPERTYTRTALIVYPYINLLGDKLAFSDLIDSHVSVPKIYAYLSHGIVLEHGGSGIDSISKILERIRALNGVRLIAKPNRSRQGRGVFAVSYTQEEGFFYNEKNVSAEELARIFSFLHDYLIMEFIESSGYSRKIFDKTCNTVRILTMIDPKTGKAFISRVSHKFGRNHCYPADNTEQGCVLTAIDEKTGKAQRSVLNKGDRFVDIEKHPDSGSDLKEFSIPNWNHVSQSMEDLANRFNYIPYIGWDAVLSDDGDITIIEGNYVPAMYMVQLAEPLLTDPKIREFYRYHKVIK